MDYPGGGWRQKVANGSELAKSAFHEEGVTEVAATRSEQQTQTSSATSPDHSNSPLHEEQQADVLLAPEAATTLPPVNVTAAPIDASQRVANKSSVDVEVLRLHAAVASGDLSAVQAFIDQKVGNGHHYGFSGGFTEKTTSRSSGLSALLMASCAGREGEIAPLEVRDPRGRTPLHTACVGGRVEVVRALLGAGANANVVDGAGFSPLHRCAQAGNLDTSRALLTPNGVASVVTDVDSPTRRGDYRPLHLACLVGSADLVGLFTRRGANVSAIDKWGCTPLHRACLEGHLEAARAVLDAGADVDAKDNWKSTSLHRTCHNGHDKIVALLLLRGASTSARDDLMNRPGQTFGHDVTSERRNAINALLTEHEKRRNSGGGGKMKTPAWSRARSADSAGPGQGKIGAYRYVPPALRQLQTVPVTPDVPSGGDGGRDSSDSVVKPWRTRTSTWSGTSEKSGPDVDETRRGMDDVGGEAESIGEMLRTGQGSAIEAQEEVELDVGDRGGAAALSSSTAGVGGVADGGFSDLHTDVFSVGDDWGVFSFDGPLHQPSLGTSRADA